MPESVERRRERARVAQRRSRAQRKATLESLQARVQVLTKALEDMTEHCLTFSDVVISAVRKDNYDFLRHNAQPFMKKVLSIASGVLDEDSDDGINENGSSSEVARYATTSPPDDAVQDLTAAEPSASQLDIALPVRAPTTVSPSRLSRGLVVESPPRPVSPCLGYGLWPSLTTLSMDDDVPPLDISPYTDIEGPEVSFAIALFWNTITLAHTALLQPTSDLAKTLFCYSLRSEPIDLILSRIHRRLAFKPSEMSVYMVEEIEDHEEQVKRQNLSSVLRDPNLAGGTSYEMSMMDRHHHMIVDSMASSDDNIEKYIDAAGVQRRLASNWGIASVEMLAHPGESPSAIDSGKPEHSPWYKSLIRQLSIGSRCVGNGIGFPIDLVDALGLQLHTMSITT